MTRYGHGWPALAAALMLAGMALPSQANTITPGGGGTLSVAVDYSTFTPGAITVNASASILHVDLLGDILVDTLGAGAGNIVGLALNQPTPTQAVSLLFALGGISPDLTAVLLTATGTAAVPPITDPALAAFLSPTSFSFALNQASLPSFDTQTGTGTLVYDFVAGQTTGSVPEPGSLALLTGGALVLVGRIRVLRRKRA